jgi:SAM-dependent methyltransferase
MLYYAADLDRTLAGFRRVLRPGGRLYATTNGRAHLREIDDLILGFRAGLRPVAAVSEQFNLENGGDSLARHFDRVTLDRQPNALLVDDPAALAEFALSMTAAGIPAEARPAFEAFVAAEMRARGGALRVTKDGGMFAAW